MSEVFDCAAILAGKARKHGHKGFKYVENFDGELMRQCQDPEWLPDNSYTLIPECKNCPAADVYDEFD